MPAKPIYRVVFLNQGKVYEIYARHVGQTGSLFGFVEIEELVFDARKGVVVDPSEERLRIGVLLPLDGIDWPTASVLLHLAHRDRYPILD